MKATFIRKLEGWNGDARLYHLDPAIKFESTNDGTGKTEYVIVSAASTLGAETFIFPARENGTTINMLELHGSFKGGLDHAWALASAGYEITEKAYVPKPVKGYVPKTEKVNDTHNYNKKAR